MVFLIMIQHKKAIVIAVSQLKPYVIREFVIDYLRTVVEKAAYGATKALRKKLLLFKSCSYSTLSRYCIIAFFVLK